MEQSYIHACTVSTSASQSMLWDLGRDKLEKKADG